MDGERWGSGAPIRVALFPGCDPLRILSDALETDADAQASPKDILMGWLLSLPSRVDPAHAAAAVLLSRAASTAIDASPQGRLIGLLLEVRRHPDLAGPAACKRTRTKRGDPRRAAWARMLGNRGLTPEFEDS